MRPRGTDSHDDLISSEPDCRSQSSEPTNVSASYQLQVWVSPYLEHASREQSLVSRTNLAPKGCRGVSKLGRPREGTSMAGRVGLKLSVWHSGVGVYESTAWGCLLHPLCPACGQNRLSRAGSQLGFFELCCTSNDHLLQRKHCHKENHKFGTTRCEGQLASLVSTLAYTLCILDIQHATEVLA